MNPKTLAPVLLLLAACAAASVEPAPALDPVPYRSAISTALLAGDTGAAVAAGHAAAADCPDDAVAALLAAEAFAAAGDDSAALAALDRAVANAGADDSMRHALVNRGALLMRAGQVELAREDLDRAHQLGEGGPELLRDLGAVCYAQGDFLAARAFWAQLPEADRAALDQIVGPGFFQDEPLALNR